VSYIDANAFYGRRLTVALQRREPTMLFIVLGVLLILLKVGEIGPVAQWSWWWVLAPFPLAAVWWAWADASGMTKRREMDKMEAKKADRRRKNLENLGLYDPRASKRGKQAQSARQRVAQKIETERAQQREAREEVVRRSRFEGEGSTSFMESEPPAKP
jgi:small Trp-rich protein